MRIAMLLVALIVTGTLFPPDTAEQVNPIVTEILRVDVPVDSGRASYYTSAAVFRGGAVLLVDGQGRGVLSFDMATRTFTHLPRGTDLGAPHLAARGPDDTVVVLEVLGPSVITLDRDLRVRSRVKLDRQVVNPKGFLSLDDGSVIVSGALARGQGEVHLFDATGGLIRSYPGGVARPASPLVQRGVSGGPLALDTLRSRILFSLGAPHAVGPLEAVTAGRPWAADSSFVPPVDDTFLKRSEVNGMLRFDPDWSFRQSKGTFPLSGGRTLNVVLDVRRGQSEWETYGEDGTLIGRTMLTTALDPLTSMGDTVVAVNQVMGGHTRSLVLVVISP